MDSYKFHDVRVEKANAVKKFNKSTERITTLFRFLELLIFFVVFSRFSAHLASPLHLSAEYLRRVSLAAVISPRSVFVVGNAIVVVLFLISRQFSGERTADFYDEYVEKCRRNATTASHQTWNKAAAPVVEGLQKKEMRRAQSAKIERVQALRTEERRRDLRRSVSDKCQKKVEEEMSGEEFRRTVEAFIARQQKFLREEEGDGAIAVA